MCEIVRDIYTYVHYILCENVRECESNFYEKYTDSYHQISLQFYENNWFISVRDCASIFTNLSYNMWENVREQTYNFFTTNCERVREYILQIFNTNLCENVRDF